MKSIIQKITTCTVALSAGTFTLPEAKAADLRLEGYGYFEVANYVRYYAKPPSQGGRFNKFRGGDYYHRAEIGMDFLSNRSNSRSGELSFEFWAMPFFGATKGIILMTEGLSPIRANRNYRNLTGEGYAISLDERRFPELNLWEFTRRGWKFRDALTFDYKAYL
jgi:hypothetical protein